MARNPNLSIILTEEEKERLRKLAEEDERTMSQLGAKLVREGMNRMEAEKKKRQDS